MEGGIVCEPQRVAKRRAKRRLVTNTNGDDPRAPQQLIPEKWVQAATTKEVDNDKAPSGKNPDWRQGYGFQFWRCQHNAFRGDGKDGQLCIVLPDEDAVISITALTGDMQAEINVVWDKLLPAFHAEPLPANAGEAEKLKQTLGELKVHPAKKEK